MPAPVISSVSPGTSASGSGAALTISGSNLTTATGVTIGGIPAAFTVVGPNITAYVPAGADPSVHPSVSVTNPSGTGTNNTLVITQRSENFTTILSTPGNYVQGVWSLDGVAIWVQLSSGAIQKTNNGGASWTTESTTGGTLGRIWAQTTSKLFAVYLDGGPGSTHPYTESNGGGTWTNRAGITTTDTFLVVSSLSDLHGGTVANHLWALDRGSNAVIRSVNNGTTWQNPYNTVNSQGNALWVVSDSDVWVAMNSGYVAHWNGTSWTESLVDLSGGLFFSIWSDGTTVYAVGTPDGSSSQIVYYSPDGGATWTRQASRLNLDPTAGECIQVMVAGGKVFGVGECNTLAEPVIILRASAGLDDWECLNQFNPNCPQLGGGDWLYSWPVPGKMLIGGFEHLVSTNLAIAPLVTGVSPTVGSTGGAEVVITGANFQPGAVVRFGGVSATSVVYNSPTSLTCIAPSHAVGVVTVRVTNPDTQFGQLVNSFTYVLQASLDYVYTTEESPSAPVAIIAPAGQDTVVGAVVRLDGRSSFSPTGLDLTYTWSFKQVPIGSQILLDGFKSLEDDSSVVSFAPDVIGLYVAELVVDDGSFGSLPAESEVNTKVVLVPQNLGIVPDMSWVWNFLSDFWNRVEQRQRFEVFWSSAIQIIAAEQLKLWQYDYNKSIQDIQELIQKRWIKYEPALSIDATLTTLIFAEDQAGLNASTFLIDVASNTPQANQPLLSNLVTVPTSEGNFARTSYGSATALGRVLQLDDLSFTFARAGVATRSVCRGFDGVTVASGGGFHGSAFSVGMVGMFLKILTGPSQGLYVIISVSDSHTMVVQNPDGSSTSFLASSGVNYSVFPQVANYNAFFANQNLVPTQQNPLAWRFSPTLVSTQYDFEAQGVSPGDVLVLQVTRTDNQKSSLLNVQVVSVDRGRIGFVFNTLDLTDGVASRELSQADQIQLANDLQVPGLMSLVGTNTLVYTDQALAIKTTVQSAAFKRQFFETAISWTSPVNLGPFSVTVVPVRVIRNSKMLVDSTIKSIPSLQEYVKQPDVVEQNGGLFQISEGKLYPLSHRPYVVYENTDYILDDQTAISGTCAVLTGDDHVVVPFGDLLDRGIRQGDGISIVDGIDTKTFMVIAVVDPQTIRVSPVPDFTEAAAKFQVSRDVSGTFIRFVEGTFTKTMPAPSRFWAEVTFFDNNDSVENNFGVLVGVLRSDLSSVGATISYKNAVAGLMYALTNGPTVANLQLASQILLGLPFTTNAGTVIEIDPSFKTNLDGSPLLGRILISAEDSQGIAVGITNIYFYPQGRQIPDPVNLGKWLPADPELSGLAINPVTGVEYAVGDKVDRFAALSKGTQVQDYLTTAGLVQEALNQGNTAFAIQRYHSFRLIVNADIATAIDTDLVAQFIKKAKPTYTKLSLALSKALEDVVSVSDSLFFRRDVSVDDNVSFSLPVSVSLDPQSVDAAYITTEGEMLSYRIFGGDLVTTQSSLQISSAAGGFVTARPFESHDSDFVRAGHRVKIIDGPNAGMYVVATVDDDTHLTLSSVDEEGDSFVFETLTDQNFVVYMPIAAKVISGTAVVVNGTTGVIPNFGIRSPGMAVGDVFVFYTNPGLVLSRLYKVVGLNNGSFDVSPPIAETSGTKQAAVFRTGLLDQHFGYGESVGMFDLTVTNTSHAGVIATSTTDPLLVLLVYPGDVIIDPATGNEYQVLDFEPTTRTLYFQPAASVTGTLSGVRLERRSRATGVITADILDRMPEDSLFLAIKTRSIASGGSGPDLTTTSTSATVGTVSGVNFDTGLGVQAGDYLLVLEGADSTRDIGFGAGVFPILAVSGTTMTLTRPLIATQGSPGILFGVQRRRPNER